MSERLVWLKNRHKGERAVLVANGPSLNGMDLGFLRSNTCIGMNKIFLGFKRFGFNPKYYIAVNDKVISQSQKEISHLNCIKFISRRNAHFVPESALTYHINTACPPKRFCEDISVGVHEGWTVTYAGLQIAYYLGFQEVVITGLDHRFSYTGAANETNFLEGHDPNHFDPSYFGGQYWDNPDLEHSEESYRIARQIFEADNRKIIDATVNGACSVFEKIAYTSVFKKDL